MGLVGECNPSWCCAAPRPTHRRGGGQTGRGPGMRRPPSPPAPTRPAAKTHAVLCVAPIQPGTGSATLQASVLPFPPTPGRRSAVFCMWCWNVMPCRLLEDTFSHWLSLCHVTSGKKSGNTRSRRLPFKVRHIDLCSAVLRGINCQPVTRYSARMGMPTS